MIREFNTGANRNAEDGKIDYEGHISPIVIESYGKFMHKNRYLKDGTYRDSDNWQKLFGDDHYGVCMKSMWRHFLSAWKAHRGYKDEDIEDSLNAIIFNASAYLHKYLQEKDPQ